MKLSLFDYHLPQELIAQKPARPRDHSRLLVLDKDSGKISHKHFYDLPDFLEPESVLVLNESKVYPARLYGNKKTGGQLEVFLLQNKSNYQWQVLIKGKNLKIGDSIYFKNKLAAKIISFDSDKLKTLEFNRAKESLYKIIARIGHTPLPPYIKTKDSKQIQKYYQTIYAKNVGSVAAPTAGLHFTKALISRLQKKGIQIYKITLHVGWGTFAPVLADDISKHKLHPEWVSIDATTARALNAAKKQNKKIVAVGTTTTRALEAMTSGAKLRSGQKWINIYIYPGYKFKFIDQLITNFHLPQSSLLFLVSALAGKTKVMKAYQIAVAKKYRFYSFGDAMFIK